jgi:membrane protease YdiL (CAAX protease family)
LQQPAVGPIIQFEQGVTKQTYWGNYQEGTYDTVLEYEKPKKIISQAGLALFIMAAVVIFSQSIIDVIVANTLPGITETDWYIWAVTAISMILIGLPTFYLIIKRVPSSPKRDVANLNIKQFFVIFFICVAAMYITNIFSVLLTLIISIIKGEDIINPALNAIQDSNYWLTLLYAVIAAPILEEVIFRKLLLDKLRRFGDLAAILLTGLAFGLFHMNLAQMFYAAVLGFIFAYVTLRTNTIRYSIILHMMINFMGSAFTPLATEQNIIGSMLLIIWMLTAVTLGIIFLILSIKKITFERATVRLPRKSGYLLNVGTILYVLICLVMIFIQTVL